jgi:hypothetical protein
MASFMNNKDNSLPSAPPQETDNNDDCPVCLNKLGNNDFVVTKCNHKICLSCFMDNYNKSRNGHLCPMCRTKVINTRRNLYVSKNKTYFEATQILCKMFNRDNNDYPIFKELIEVIETSNLRKEIFKDLFARHIMREFIENFTKKLNITK